jgi:hypothetical protein
MEASMTSQGDEGEQLVKLMKDGKDVQWFLMRAPPNQRPRILSG